METTNIVTEFAPADRASKDTIIRDHGILCSLAYVQSVIDAMPQIVFVLNQNRQIVFANRVFYDAFHIDDVNAVLGLRPGEALNCDHASDNIGGCGTAKHCQNCGAVLAIQNSLQGTVDNQTCHIFRKIDGQVFELRVKAAPLVIDNTRFSIVSAIDISHENRRRILERIFFHDVINVAGSIQGLSEILNNIFANSDGKNKEIVKAIFLSASNLLEEIFAQRDLAAAENNELCVRPSRIDSVVFLYQIEKIFESNLENERTFRIDPSSHGIQFESDPVLLRRIIGNLIKNAVEGSGFNDIITVGCEVQNPRIRFWVHNPGTIPDQIQPHIFQRSFSTKGSGRGLGTYSIKLLTERYLKGIVSFTSSVDAGTIFNVSLSLHL